MLELTRAEAKAESEDLWGSGIVSKKNMTCNRMIPVEHSVANQNGEHDGLNKPFVSRGQLLDRFVRKSDAFEQRVQARASGELAAANQRDLSQNPFIPSCSSLQRLQSHFNHRNMLKYN